jgi:hypothetical protein
VLMAACEHTRLRARPSGGMHLSLEVGISETLLALDIAQLRPPASPHQQVRDMTRRQAVLQVAQTQRLLADRLDLPIEIHQQHPVALQQALVLQEPPRARREPPSRHMPLTPIHARHPHRRAAPQLIQRKIRQAPPDLFSANTNARLERPRHSDLNAGGRRHSEDDTPATGRLPSGPSRSPAWLLLLQGCRGSTTVAVLVSARCGSVGAAAQRRAMPARQVRSRTTVRD